MTQAMRVAASGKEEQGRTHLWHLPPVGERGAAPAGRSAAASSAEMHPHVAALHNGAAGHALARVGAGCNSRRETGDGKCEDHAANSRADPQFCSKVGAM